MQALGGPVVVGIARVEFFVRAPRQTSKLRSEGPFAELCLLMALLLPPLGSAVLEPNLEREKRKKVWSLLRQAKVIKNKHGCNNNPI